MKEMPQNANILLLKGCGVPEDLADNIITQRDGGTVRKGPSHRKIKWPKHSSLLNCALGNVTLAGMKFFSLIKLNTTNKLKTLSRKQSRQN